MPHKMTAAVLAPGESITTSVRKIDNGYIKTVSKSTPDTYESREEFSATRPVLEERMGEASGTSSMARAIKALNSSR